MEPILPEPRQWEEGWECPKCHLKRGADQHDPCLGELPGVKYACCGHGRKGYGYITFDNGKVIRFDLKEVER